MNMSAEEWEPIVEKYLNDEIGLAEAATAAGWIPPAKAAALQAVVDAALKWREVPGPIWTDSTEDEIAKADADLLDAIEAYRASEPSRGDLCRCCSW